MKFEILSLLILGVVVTPAFAGFGYRIMVNMAQGSWASMGKMDATLSFSRENQDTARPKVTLQPHMIKIEAGKSYSEIIETQYPIDNLIAVTLHWRRKSLGAIFNRRSILVDNVVVEPVYLLGELRTSKTLLMCGDKKTAVEIKPDSRGFFAKSFCF
jgi:hypothetical protein